MLLRAVERGHVERAAEPQPGRDVVGHAPGLELVQHPETLLRERHPRAPRASLRRALAPLAVGVGHHRRYPVDEAARALVPQESAA